MYMPPLARKEQNLYQHTNPNRNIAPICNEAL